MAEENDDKVKNQADNTQDDVKSKARDGDEMTNVRHQEAEKLVAELKTLAHDDKNRGFEIGDLVEKATTQYKLRVTELVKKVGLSRQRLSDCRITAVAFNEKSRRKDIPFHFFTLAARAAQKSGTNSEEMLNEVMKNGLESTRQVSAFFASKQRSKDNARALEGSAILMAKHGDLLNHCHHDDFRNVITRLGDGSVKLIIADAPYDGLRKSSTSATKRAIDGNTAAESRKLIEDLLELSRQKMAKGGALILFRPGAAMDPPWLGKAIDANGWICSWGLTWDKHKIKLGQGDSPYGIASERILVLCRKGDKLTKHDASSRDDVVDLKAIQPHYSDTDPHHQHEKPLELTRHFIGKHTFEGETVVEPFGGSGSACQAAAEMNRRWLYCEKVKENLEMAVVRINNVVEKAQKKSA